MGLFKDCGCGCGGQKQQQKFMASLLGALIFFVIASPEAFRFVRGVAGNWVATPNGSPSTGGLLLHALVFLLIVWWTMNVRVELMEAEEDLIEEAPIEEELIEEELEEVPEEDITAQEPPEEMIEGEEVVAEMLDGEVVETSLVEEPLLGEDDITGLEPEGVTLLESDLTMTDPEGEVLDNCVLKSGKSLTIRN
jgi:hypothetical protein